MNPTFPQSIPSATGPNSLWSGFVIQARVIHALVLRELLTRFGRHNVGFMWLFAEPMIFTLGVTALWNILKATSGGGHGGIPITAFVLTGYSAVLLWRNMPGRCMNALLPNFSLMYHRHVKAIDVYLSRTILEAVGATMSCVILSVAFISLGMMDPPRDYLTAIYGWMLLVWFAFGLSIFIGALSEKFDIIEKFWHPAMYLLVPLSGSFTMQSTLPPGFREVLQWNPTVNCVELFRQGYLGDSFKWYYDVDYVVIVNMILTIFALAQVRYVSRNLTLE